MADLTPATELEFTTFLAKYGYSVTEDKEILLARSFAFLDSLPFCDDVDLDADVVVEGQCFLAYAMSTEGGLFDPFAIADPKTLIEKGIGRNAVSKKWQVNDDLNDHTPISNLKTVPMAFGVLKNYMCYGTAGVYYV